VHDATNNFFSESLIANIVILLTAHLKDILASTFSQCCIIWNVKEKKPIFKLTDANSRVFNFFYFDCNTCLEKILQLLFSDIRYVGKLPNGIQILEHSCA